MFSKTTKDFTCIQRKSWKYTRAVKCLWFLSQSDSLKIKMFGINLTRATMNSSLRRSVGKPHVPEESDLDCNMPVCNVHYTKSGSDSVKQTLILVTFVCPLISTSAQHQLLQTLLLQKLCLEGVDQTGAPYNRSRHHFLQVVLQEKGTWPSIFILSSSKAMYSDWNISPQHCSHPYNSIVLSAWKTKGRERKWGRILLPSALLWNTLWFVTFIQLQTYEGWVLLSTKESVQTSSVMPLQLVVLLLSHVKITWTEAVALTSLWTLVCMWKGKTCFLCTYQTKLSHTATRLHVTPR